MPLTVAIQMDPIEKIDINGNSDFALALEAQNRGHNLLYYGPRGLSFRDGKVGAHVRPLHVRAVKGDHFALGEGFVYDLAAADVLRARARRLYLRAQRYGLRGLEVKHPGFSKSLLTNPKATVRKATKSDVPLLYWTAAAWASAISLSKDNPELVGQIPVMEALIDRAMELDEGYGKGAIHTFMISYEMSRAGAAGDAAARARKHFERAMVLSKGTEASPLVALAEAVTIQKQDVKEFESLLNQALAINPDANPDNRLVNIVMQRRARWLLSRKSELFLVQ